MDPARLAEFEQVVGVFYNPPSDEARQAAQAKMLTLQESPQSIPHCQYILEHSTNQEALLTASNALTHLVTAHWNNFSATDRVDIRNYVLSYLAGNSGSLQHFVVTSLIQLVCRITKLGWSEDSAHQEIVTEVTRFLEATVQHCVVGLMILHQLVAEISQPVVGRTLTQHRRTAVSFRDTALFGIFRIALTTVRQLHMNAVQGADAETQARLGLHALRVLVACLYFDFVGMNPDDSSEEVGTIQVPTSWRVVVQDPSTVQLLFDYYETAAPPQSHLALESIMLLASVKRNLFSDEDRRRFLGQLLTNIHHIMEANVGLGQTQNYHEFCRLLGRIKASYQLTELVSLEGYEAWLSLACRFTVESFKQWQVSTHSIHYLLSFWARLVTAVPYVKSAQLGRERKALLDRFVPSILSAYVESRLGAVEQILRDDLDDPLEAPGLHDELERLPPLCHLQYDITARQLLAIFDPLFAQYREGAALNPNDPNVADKMRVLECQMAWLVYLIGFMIGQQPGRVQANSANEELVDATLCRRVFELMTVIDRRCETQNNEGVVEVPLEMALLNFLQKFNSSFVSDYPGAGRGAAGEPTHSGSGTMVVSAGGSTISGLPGSSGGIGGGGGTLGSRLMGRHAGGDAGDPMSSKAASFARRYEAMGMGSCADVVNVIAVKIVNNLRRWPDDDRIIHATLELFNALSDSRATSRVLQRTEAMNFLVTSHTAEHFPFLVIPANVRQRTVFHVSLGRVVFANTDNLEARFNAFMEPLLRMLGELGQVQDLRQVDVRTAVIGVARDLRGVAQATTSRRTYGLLFDALYPAHFPVFVRALGTFSDDPEVTTAVLTFTNEFVSNKCSRLTFSSTSANGILLFRQTSEILYVFGSRLFSQPVVNDPYKERYKGITLCLRILTNSLYGNYVNFGVFALYNDPALDHAIDTCLQLALSVDLNELLTVPKLARAYFAFLEVLCRHHLAAVMRKPHDVVVHLVQSLNEGLSAADSRLVNSSATAIDNLASFFFQNHNKDTEEMGLLRAHLQQSPTLLSDLLPSVLHLLLFALSAPNKFLWVLSRPILSLILIAEDTFVTFKNNMMSTQSPEKQAKLEIAFNKLLANIQPNLETPNREQFTNRLQEFVTDVHTFLTH